MAAEATDLHPFPTTSPLELGPRSRDNLSRVRVNTEVRPVEMIVGTEGGSAVPLRPVPV